MNVVVPIVVILVNAAFNAAKRAAFPFRHLAAGIARPKTKKLGETAERED